MTRVEGWEKKLRAVIEKHSALPSIYGVSDCYLIPDDTVEAVTGRRMFEGIQYTNEIGAAKQLQQRGFSTVEDAFASKFERIAPATAMRGDIGVIERNNQVCGGVFTAIGFMTRDETRVVYLPISQVKSAFKVGR